MWHFTLRNRGYLALASMELLDYMLKKWKIILIFNSHVEDFESFCIYLHFLDHPITWELN